MNIIHATKDKTQFIPIEDDVLYTEEAVKEIISRVIMAAEIGYKHEEIKSKRPRDWL